MISARIRQNRGLRVVRTALEHHSMATRGAGRATATQAQSRVQGGAGRTRKLRGARTGCSSSPASRGWSATLTCPMRGACDRWVMSRPRAVAPHLDLSLNTYAGLGRPHRAVLTCLTMSGSFRRVLVTITVTRARVRASKSALPAAHLMQGRCVPCRTGWTQGRAGNTCRLSLPAPGTAWTRLRHPCQFPWG